MGTREDYNCFGCSPYNEIGLQLEFWENNNELIAYWEPRKSLEGWSNILHGGIQASLLDELAGWLVLIKQETAGVTSELNVKYLKPVNITKGRITVKGYVESLDKRIVNIRAALFDGENTECASADIKYYCFPQNVAKARYHYPGKEAFYQE